MQLNFAEREEENSIIPEKMVYAYRGDNVESIHRGSAVICDCEGRITFEVGNPEFSTYMRSVAKPFQVIPLIETGAARKFGFTNREIAIMSGSHSGEDVHVKTLGDILNKAGLSESDLKCGVHIPHYYAVKSITPRPSDVFSPLHNNCSGKHASMLALCKFKSWLIDEYLGFDHPCQKMILKAVADACHYPTEKIGRGVDGCGAPVFALPLKNIAQGMAQLLSPNTVPREIAKVYSGITLAMREYPEMVSGEGRFDYEIAKVTNGRIISKAGAEGVQLFGLPDARIGGAIKIEDGSRRAAYPATVEFLYQTGNLSEKEVSDLGRFATPEILDHNNEIVGRIRSRFEVRKMD
ncbi:MAG: asparaginase [candidate division Zixibacteria bacterium CG_4_9_14_3_um_filter_46_8]|nr:MAG: asparaginase [candidate division Zixibacteria bacterium CG_4_9_14_3_um_filter_46_8]